MDSLYQSPSVVTCHFLQYTLVLTEEYYPHGFVLAAFRLTRVHRSKDHHDVSIEDTSQCPSKQFIVSAKKIFHLKGRGDIVELAVDAIIIFKCDVEMEVVIT